MRVLSRFVPTRAEQIGFAFMAALAIWLVGPLAETRRLAGLRAEAISTLGLRDALLATEVARFRLLPRALGDDRDVVATLAGSGTARAALDRKLERLAAETGAAAIYLLDRRGIAVAASNWRSPQSFVGTDYGFRNYYIEAARTGAAEQFALGTVSRRAGLYLVRRTNGGGYVVVKLELNRVEAAWRDAGGLSFVTNGAGLILISSKPALRFNTTRPLDPASARRAAAAVQVDASALRPLPVTFAADGLARDDAGARLLWSARASAVGDWRLNLLQPVEAPLAAAKRTARLMLALVLVLVGGAIVLFGRRVRRRAAAAEATARRTAELEATVAERTAALRAEIDERTASEARAAELRDGLRQANRLATLGQVTASIAHETAQPVAAIRSYAVNGRALLERGDMAAVEGNLDAIARLTERIGTVTAELRGFARKGTGRIQPMRLIDVFEGAALMLKDGLARVDYVPPTIDPGLCVVAGRVRLEQVLVNLIQNALDALAGRPDPVLRITIMADAALVRLRIADNGPGLPPAVAERLFMPFVTSKPTGLGLGLVIAHDIMADLGGALRLVASDGPGACFEVELRRAPSC